MVEKIEVGIIGGSGFCTFPEMSIKEKVRLTTRHGEPSDEISIGEYGGQIIAFLPRHGYEHQLAPHLIPYRANIDALKEVGIDTIIAFCAAGSLRKKIKPGDLVIPDQFVNLTWGRDATDNPSEEFIHLPMDEPYSQTLRECICEEGEKIGLRIHKKGIVAVIQGPRFNTKAESDWFSRMGWSIVNMTQYPECYFAKEEGIHYAAIAGITDYDVCLQNYGLSMSRDQIRETSQIFNENVTKCKQLVAQVLQNWNSHKTKLMKLNTYYQPYYKKDDLEEK